jgi:hypothetical protein
LVAWPNLIVCRAAGKGTTKSIQGERPSTVIFKKEAEGYTGTITGVQGTAPLKEIKVDGDT